MNCGKRLVQACVCAAVLLICGTANAVETVYDNTVNRDREKVYVISNLPQEEIMRPICREALMRKDHCRYVRLGEVGMFGKKKSDLLDYDWRNKNETIVVVDRSKLDVGQKVSLQRLMAEIFPSVEESSKSQVILRAQNSGDKAWQALIDVPDAMWLEKGIPDLMSHVGECHRVMEVQNVAILSTSPGVSSYMLDWFRYGTKQQMDMEKWQEFRDAPGMSHKILAINWNDDDPCTPDMANDVLPEDLREYCDQSGADRVGLTPWDRFCREAVADVRSKDGTDYWVIRAPTEKHLNTLAQMVVKSNYAGGPFRLNLCDLTHIGSLAVGTYLDGPDLNRDRLVLQQELETAAQNSLQLRVKSMYSSQNWGEIIQDVLGSDTGNPFADPGGAQRVVQASNADALLVLWVRDARPAVEYSCRSERITPPLPAFNEPEPVKPDPQDKKCMWCGSKYPGETREDKANSEEFRRDYRDWQDKYDRWDRNKRDYEQKKRSHQVNWQFTIQSVPKVSMTGYLKVIDLRTQTQLWTCPVELTQTGDVDLVRTVPAQVYGDDNHPQQPRLPENEYAWNSSTLLVGQEAFMVALRQGLSRLADSVLWANDLNPRNAPQEVHQFAEAQIDEPEPTAVSIECVGVMPCAANPTGDAKAKLSKAALSDALDQILEKAQTDYPETPISRDLVAGKALVKSEGWNPSAKEYRVRVLFECEIAGQ